MARKRRRTGSPALGEELKRRRGTRTLQELSDLSRSPRLAGLVDPIGVSTLHAIEEAQTMPTVRSLHTLATLHRIPVARLVDILAAERHRLHAESEAVDLASLREQALEAHAAEDFELAHSACLRWELGAEERTERASAVSYRAIATWRLGDAEEAIRLLLSLQADGGLSDELLLTSFARLTEVFLSTGNVHQAGAQAEAGIHLAARLGSRLEHARLLRLSACVRCDWAASARPVRREQLAVELRRAVEELGESSALFEELGFHVESLLNDVEIGRALTLLDEFSEASRVLGVALDRLRIRRHARGEAAALLELGRLHYQRSQLDRARSLFWQSERIASPANEVELAFTDYYYLMRIEERADGDAPFFFRKCKRLHPAVTARTPEVAAFEQLLVDSRA